MIRINCLLILLITVFNGFTQNSRLYFTEIKNKGQVFDLNIECIVEDWNWRIYRYMRFTPI